MRNDGEAQAEGRTNLCLAPAEELVKFRNTFHVFIHPGSLPGPRATGETFHIKLSIPVKFIAPSNTARGGDNITFLWV